MLGVGYKDPCGPHVPVFGQSFPNEPAQLQALYVLLLGDHFSSALKLDLLSSYNISMFRVTDSFFFFFSADITPIPSK